jgi:rare lipoprotein A
MIAPMKAMILSLVVAAGALVMTGCGASARVVRTGGGTAVAPGTTQVGAASYYSDSLAGETTANGESYDPGEMTAAHRSLPFGTRVSVRRIDNDRSVVVRINDRGPFVGGRIIDLSRAAATALQMLRAGVARVELEVLSVPQPRGRRASR